MNINTSGRKDVTEYFKQSGIREHKTLNHTPFLVFTKSVDSVDVKIVKNAKDLLTYSDDTQVMAQWSGQYRSDFFQFNVGDLRRHVAEHPPEAHHII